MEINGEVVRRPYVSGEVVAETSNAWPLAAIGWGLALGTGIVLVLRLNLEPPLPKGQHPTGFQIFAEGFTSAGGKTRGLMPWCDRRLRAALSVMQALLVVPIAVGLPSKQCSSPSSTPATSRRMTS